MTADYLSRIVCGIFFVFLPTTLVRPEITGTGFWDQALRFVYSIDQSANLFPSIHCLVSWFCYIGIRHQKKIPVWYQRFSLVFAILVCISTQVTKQHYIIDVFGGIILSEVCYLIGRKTNLYQGLWKVLRRSTNELVREKICEIQREIIGDQRVGKMKNKKKVIGNTVFFFALFGLTAYAVLKGKELLSWRKF